MDVFLEIGRRPSARRVVQGLGLPIPVPLPLERSAAPWSERPLEGRAVAVVGGELVARLSSIVQAAGATVAASPAADASLHAVVVDAIGVEEPAGLRLLFDALHERVSSLATGGRVVVLGRAVASTGTTAAAAAQAGLTGFVRSLAKEVGRRAATATLVYVEPGAEARLEPVLRWFLSGRSSFVTGQVLTVSNMVTAPEGAVPHVRPLAGRVALVTGAARGIGEATARSLAREGAHVVCLDRPDDGELLGRVAREVGGSTLEADVTAVDAPARIVAALTEAHGGVDVVVHNAGITRDKTLARMRPELWDQAVEVNLASVVRITEALLDGTLRDQGRIVCLSSAVGIAGNLGQTNYSASKAGVIGLVQHLGARLAERGIAVNALAPGFIETRLTDAMPVMLREFSRRLSALGQGGRPEDVAEAITFFASPGAYGITGGVMRVCGGLFIGA